MNNTLLLQQFDLLATAPGGVAKLRELILTLAVQGKLVPQDPADEPASELLQRIRAEKDRLIAEKKIRRSKPLEAISDDENSFELPSGWAWERLGNLGDWGAGATPSRSTSAYYGGHIPWFKSGELTADFISESEETVTEDALRNCSLRLNQVGDVLVAMYGATIGKTAILSVVGTTNQAVCACTPFSGLQNTYLLLLLKAIKPYLIGLGTGGAQPNISREKIISVVIGLPPLPEQVRIVTRVEALMRVCDALEAKGQQQAAHHRQLVQTLLGTLTDPDSATPTQDAWQRVTAHFDALLDRPSAVDALEQTILQLAVRGQLVPQDPADEPASELLKRIRTEKDRLIAAGKIKRDKPLVAIAEEERPFELQRGWEWVRVADICSFLTDGEHLTPERCEDPTAVPLVTAKNVRSEAMDYRQTDYVPRAVAEQCWKRCKPEVGDILMVSVGATLGRLTVLREPADMVLVRSVTVLRPVHVAVDVSYLALHLMAPGTQTEIWANVKQSAQPCLYLAKSASLTVALPPLAEQTRIVARVAHLRRLCAELRQRLTQSQTTQAALAEALVTHDNG